MDSREEMRWCPKKHFDIERFHELLKPSLERGQLTNDGPLQAVARSLVKKITSSTRSILMCSNGTAALHTLVSMWNIARGKQLVWATQAFTFPSAIQGPLQHSLVIDQDEEHWGPSFSELEDIKDQIDGIIVTNIQGLLCSALKYEEWGRENGKLVLFDNAATPVGFVEDGRCIQDLGDGAFVSLHETKPIGRGEGGALFVDNHMYDAALSAMNFGFDVSQVIRIPNRSSR